jgi:hypothetical protein
MERDEVKEAWSRCEAYLKRSEALNQLIVANSLARRVRSRLAREQRMLGIEITANFVAIVMLGAIGFGRGGTLSLAIASAVLGAALIAVNIALIAVAVALKRIDFDKPVVTIQAGLERIKIGRAGITAGVLLAAPLLWTPLLVVSFGLFGSDATKVLGVPYLAANLAAGGAIAVAGWISARRIKQGTIASKWLARAVEALSGESYREAAAFLDSIERFRSAA